MSFEVALRAATGHATPSLIAPPHKVARGLRDRECDPRSMFRSGMAWLSLPRIRSMLFVRTGLRGCRTAAHLRVDLHRDKLCIATRQLELRRRELDEAPITLPPCAKRLFGLVRDDAMDRFRPHRAVQ